MPTEQQTETRRLVAEKLVSEFYDGHPSSWLIDAIEAALKDRDERAARIAETAFKEFQTGYNAGKWIAAAIRNEDRE